MRWAYLVVALLLVCAPAFAQATPDALLEGVDMGGLVQWSADQAEGLDVKDLMGKLARGEAQWAWEDVRAQLVELAMPTVREAARWLVALFAPALIWAAVQALRPDGGVAQSVGFVCALCVAAQLIALFERCIRVATDALNAMGALCETLYPILAALLAAAGKGAGSALFTPVAAMTGALVSTALARGTPIVAGACAALTIAGNLSDQLRLGSMAALVRKAGAFLLGALMTGFVGVMTVQGILARGYDGASIQTARFAVGSLVPIVGGEVADSLDAIITSAQLVRNAAGVTGLILLLSACARPAIYLGLSCLCVRLAAALVEPLASGPAQKMLDGFGGVLALLFAALAAGAVLVLVVIGAALSIFGG